jgi:hypothetical protein
LTLGLFANGCQTYLAAERAQKHCQVFIAYLQEQPNRKVLPSIRFRFSRKPNHKSNVKYVLHVRKNNQISTMVKLEGKMLKALVSIYRLLIAGESNNFQHKRDDKHTFEIESVQVYVLCLYYMHDFRDAFF